MLAVTAQSHPWIVSDNIYSVNQSQGLQPKPMSNSLMVLTLASQRYVRPGHPGLASWDILSSLRDGLGIDPGLTSWATLSRPCGTGPDNARDGCLVRTIAVGIRVAICENQQIYC